ncbi:substrate-binding domain-containing protein [Paraoerskovia marina]|uniref:substrate-binding domain-containing protein n=1 Tax=Paraoerskovia marina TaxID=545619 RepID=UPI0012DF2899|nr:substrate-binding domain-containing protein [Paraoerskovia marina]
MASTRRSRGGGPWTLGVLSPVVGGYYFGCLLSGIAQSAREGGHRVVAVQTYPSDLERDEFPERPTARYPVGLDRFDGVVAVTSAVDHETLRAVEASGVPLVLLSERAEGVSAPVVTPDNTGGVRLAVEHLIGHGHERIGFVGSLLQPDIVERYESYRSTLRAHGIAPTDAWLYRTADNQEVSAAVAGRLAVEAGLPTTAVVAATDRNAVGFSAALRAQGLSLPRDQAVVGFDHSDSGARVRPRLATVEPHHDRVGALAARLLLARIGGEDVRGDFHCAATLVTRESCGCLGGGRGADRAEEGEACPRERLLTTARSIFGVSGDGESTSGRVVPTVDAWHDAVCEVLDRGASDRAPGARALQAIADATAALRPHPEALERLIPAIRAVEDAVADRVRAPRPTRASAARVRAVRAVGTDLVTAVTTGCSQVSLHRSGRLERMIADQYELDLDLMHADRDELRGLDWMPRGHRGAATLALWADTAGRQGAGGGRELEVVGTTLTTPEARPMIGRRIPRSAFPPPALVGTEAAGAPITFVIPVTFESSNWGVLMIDGAVDTRATSARDKFDHWAVMLAVALDREEKAAASREQQAALERAADRERRLALEVRASAERYALAADAALEGTWDWDVVSGVVFYSARWKALLGHTGDEVGQRIDEWTGRVHPEDLREVQIAIAAQLAGDRDPLVLEHRLRGADGEYRWMLCRARTVDDDAGRRARMVGILVDNSDAKRREAELRSRALVDPRTGTVHPELFADRLDGAIGRARGPAAYDSGVVAVDVTEASDVTRSVVRSVLEPGDSLCVRDRELLVLMDGDSPGSRARRAAALQQLLGDDAQCASVTSLMPYTTAEEVLRELRAGLSQERARLRHRRRES